LKYFDETEKLEYFGVMAGGHEVNAKVPIFRENYVD